MRRWASLTSSVTWKEEYLPPSPWIFYSLSPFFSCQHQAEYKSWFFTPPQVCKVNYFSSFDYQQPSSWKFTASSEFQQSISWSAFIACHNLILDLNHQETKTRVSPSTQSAWLRKVSSKNKTYWRSANKGTGNCLRRQKSRCPCLVWMSMKVGCGFLCGFCSLLALGFPVCKGTEQVLTHLSHLLWGWGWKMGTVREQTPHNGLNKYKIQVRKATP